MHERDDTPEGWGSQDKFNAVLETAWIATENQLLESVFRGWSGENLPSRKTWFITR